MEETDTEEPQTEETAQPVPLKESLIERSRKIKEAFNLHIERLDGPTTVSEIAKAINANRVTVAKYIAQSMQNGNPHNFGVRKVGMYEIIWKKCPDKETETEVEA